MSMQRTALASNAVSVMTPGTAMMRLDRAAQAIRAAPERVRGPLRRLLATRLVSEGLQLLPANVQRSHGVMTPRLVQWPATQAGKQCEATRRGC